MRVDSPMNAKRTRPLKLNVFDLTGGLKDDWNNFIVSEVNDHVVRVCLLQRDFHWHSHSASDEAFYVIEGTLFVDLDGGTEKLAPGEMITIPRRVRHRTRSAERTLILCFESKDNDVMGDQ